MLHAIISILSGIAIGIAFNHFLDWLKTLDCWHVVLGNGHICQTSLRKADAMFFASLTNSPTIVRTTKLFGTQFRSNPHYDKEPATQAA